MANLPKITEQVKKNFVQALRWGFRLRRCGEFVYVNGDYRRPMRLATFATATEKELRAFLKGA